MPDVGDAPEERLGLFLDFENLAIGARDALRRPFDYKLVAHAMAVRGRLLVRRAYADWSMFADERRQLARHNVELIEIPQRMGVVRKNAADIKLAVDAVELAFERDYITTFVIGTGDSDFTPLVDKLRGLDKQVIGIGVEQSTSALLPPACDEFIFYDRLVDHREPAPADDNGGAVSELDVGGLVVRTLSELQQSGSETVRSSALKRAILRKDPTFREADYGFRAFGELLASVAQEGIVSLDGDPDPFVTIPASGKEESAAMELLREVVAAAQPVAMSGLKDELRKRRPKFNERRLGYSGFLQFCRAADARGVIDLQWDDALGDYRLTLPG